MLFAIVFVAAGCWLVRRRTAQFESALNSLKAQGSVRRCKGQFEGAKAIVRRSKKARGPVRRRKGQSKGANGQSKGAMASKKAQRPVRRRKGQ